MKIENKGLPIFKGQSVGTIRLTEGGPGSGNFGHAGVPGQHGGSASGGGTKLPSKSSASLSTMQNGKVVSSVVVEGKLDVKIVSFENGTQAVFKEPLRASGFIQKNYPNTPTREVAVYEIDRELGFDVVPPTTEVEYEGRKGSMMSFVEGQTAAKVGSRRVQDYHPDLEKIAALDIITNHADRHDGNFMKSSDGRWLAVDNDLTLNSGQALYSNPFMAVEGMVISKEVKTGLSKLSDGRLRDILHKSGIPQPDVDNAVSRLNWLKQQSTWPGRVGDLDSAIAKISKFPIHRIEQ